MYDIDRVDVEVCLAMRAVWLNYCSSVCSVVSLCAQWCLCVLSGVSVCSVLSVGKEKAWPVKENAQCVTRDHLCISLECMSVLRY